MSRTKTSFLRCAKPIALVFQAVSPCIIFALKASDSSIKLADVLALAELEQWVDDSCCSSSCRRAFRAGIMRMQKRRNQT